VIPKIANFYDFGGTSSTVLKPQRCNVAWGWGPETLPWCQIP